MRDMLGLADRGRVLDLFEKVMGGKIAEALTDLSGLYDCRRRSAGGDAGSAGDHPFPHPRESRARRARLFRWRFGRGQARRRTGGQAVGARR